jgi:hypothetical protein
MRGGVLWATCPLTGNGPMDRGARLDALGQVTGVLDRIRRRHLH